MNEQMPTSYKNISYFLLLVLEFSIRFGFLSSESTLKANFAGTLHLKYYFIRDCSYTPDSA